MNIKKKEIIKCCVAVSILIIVIAIVITIILKYQVNGETNMPFQLSKITIISTAEGEQNTDAEGETANKWNFNINQSNDVYFFLDKNEAYKKIATLDSVDIENINITKTPQVGTIQTYMPNSEDGRRYVYKDNFLVHNKLEYTGGKVSNEKTLEIGNQGGQASIRFANMKAATYKSDDDTEIIHDGTLFKKTATKNEDLQFTVNFDFIITVGKIKYKANITLELPYGNIIESGTTNIEKTDLSDIIFKRI